jgi:hypothetical protein
VQITRTLKCKGVKNAVGVYVVLGIMLKFGNVGDLSSLSMFALIAQAGRRCHKIPKVGVKGIVRKGD